MRAIKFRAWNGSKMVEWDDIWSRWDVCDLIGSQGVIPLQWTGLKDKNGKGIYEGDILKDDCNDLHLVAFGELPLHKSGDCTCAYQSFYGKCYGKLGQAPYYECTEIGEWMEVIGNIYENKELLKR